MILPLLDDQVNEWMANTDPSTQAHQSLDFGTDDQASFAFTPVGLGADYSQPYYLPTQNQAALGFATGDLTFCNFSFDNGMAGVYGVPVAQPSPFFQMGLGGAMMSSAAGDATRYAGPYVATSVQHGSTLPDHCPTSTTTAMDPSNAFPYDEATNSSDASSSFGRLAVAGPSTSAGSDIDRPDSRETVEVVDAWFDFDGYLNDTDPAGAGRESTTTPTAVDHPAVVTIDLALNTPLVAVPTVSPSMIRGTSPDIESQHPTAWLEGGELIGLSTGPGYQSDASMARTSPSVAPFDWGVGPSASTNTGPSVTSGHYYDAYAPRVQHSEQLGLYVQAENTQIAPAVTGLQPEIAYPATASRKPAAPAPVSDKAARSSKVRAQKTTKATSSRKPAARAAASGKAARSSKQRSKKTSKAKASKATKPRAPQRPKNPFPRVPWEQSERGLMCKELKLTKGSPGPFQCFICEQYEAPGAAKVYDEWKSFQSHVGRCAPVEDMLPRCHFCHERIAAYGRAHQMERHLVGYDGYPACEVLADLVRNGKNTHFAIGAWLETKKRPILPEFLGRRLAKAFHHAVYSKYERDKLADLTPQHRKKKVKKADEVEGESGVEDEDEDESEDE